MTFTLSAEQSRKLAYIQKFSGALENVRRKNLEKLKNPELSGEQKAAIWNANFTLHYICELQKEQKKIFDILKLLDGIAVTMLANHLDKLTENPDIKLNEFIEQFYQNNANLNKELQNLRSFYSKVLLISGIGIVACIGITIASILVPTLLFAFVPAVLSVFILGAISYALFCVSEGVNDAITSLTSLREPTSYRYTGSYYYEETIGGQTRGISISTPTRTELTSTLRDNFFHRRTPPESGIPISDEVQTECNRLVAAAV